MLSLHLSLGAMFRMRSLHIIVLCVPVSLASFGPCALLINCTIFRHFIIGLNCQVSKGHQSMLVPVRPQLQQHLAGGQGIICSHVQYFETISQIKDISLNIIKLHALDYFHFQFSKHLTIYTGPSKLGTRFLTAQLNCSIHNCLCLVGVNSRCFDKHSEILKKVDKFLTVFSLPISI